VLPHGEIANRVVAHYRAHARDLPFRKTRDPYAIWVCEIMAQQTRLAVVIPYWERWLARFPTVRSLAGAPLDDVLAHWAGLGYYARARGLHRAAKVLVERHGGRLPDDVAELAGLPGIGPYTAGAIASIAFGKRAPIVDGNVARIFARLFGIEADVLAPATKREMWRLAGDLVPAASAGEFNQGLMDLGATICTPRSPSCLVCPLADLCEARRQGRQAELPLARKKGATPLVDVAAAWIRDRRGRWLLCRRAPEGLFGGLWELPDAAALGIAIGGRGEKPIAEHTHQLSHRTIRYRVYAAAGTPSMRPPYDSARFFTPAELESLGVSSATAALARALLETDPWQTPTAQEHSSKKGSTRSSRGWASSATTSKGTRTSARPPRGRRKG
jgi:A/G-specific adenine glycosylase